MRKKILIALVCILVLAFVGYKYIYKSHRDISAEPVSYSVSVDDIYINFQANEQSANAKYLDKTIEIYGKITNLALQNVVALKGRLTGFDDLLGEIQMDQCTIK